MRPLSWALSGLSLIAMLLIPIDSFAQNKILKVSEKLHRVGIELGSLKVGDTVEVKANGKSCQIKVVKVTDKLAIGDAALCDSIISLNGQSVTPSSSDENWDEEDSEPDLDEPQSKVKRSKNQDKKKIGIGFGLYYSFADTIKSSGNIAGLPISETDKTEPAFGLYVNYNNISKGHFGSLVSIDYEMNRSIKSYSGTIGGMSVSGSDNAKFNFFNLTSNIGYGPTDQLFLFGGINYPISMSVSNSVVNFRGDIGFQIGAGYRFTDLISASLEYRWIRAKGDYTGTNPFTGQPASATYDSVNLNGLVLRLGLNF
jgi:hypothetical protein